MATLYIIGGSPRVGKTTVARAFLQQKPMVYISTDALRFGLRKALFDESFVVIDDLRFEGDVRFRRPRQTTFQDRHFVKHTTENKLSWKAAQGIIDHYDRRNEDILVEGIACTPAHIAALKLKHLSVRAVFLGFSHSGHGDAVLQHASANKRDWINDWLHDTDGNEKEIRDWIVKEARIGRRNEQSAAKYGFGFFDVTKRSFPDHIQAVQAYLAAEGVTSKKGN